MSRDPDAIEAQADGLRARIAACWCASPTVLSLCDKCEAAQDQVDDLETEYEAARTAAEEEEGVCPTCNGSGEGFCGPSHCSSCGGSGAARSYRDDDEPHQFFDRHDHHTEG